MVRWLQHLLLPNWWRLRDFNSAVLNQIEQAIAESEVGHSGEICFAVEGSLSLFQLLKGLSPRQRSQDVFSKLRVWDTQNNNGVLIYLLIADRDVEVVVDRACASQINAEQWQRIADTVKCAAQNDKLVAGVIQAIQQSAELLREAFPLNDKGDTSAASQPTNPDELPNKPVRL
ncbi:MAG: TPM domain-containing protein [Pseudomonadota bacterium]|nr:TPM domain-containing protein [Pseudomonadota bacterium]